MSLKAALDFEKWTAVKSGLIHRYWLLQITCQIWEFFDFGEDTNALTQQAEVKDKNKDKQKNRG